MCSVLMPSCLVAPAISKKFDKFFKCSIEPLLLMALIAITEHNVSCFIYVCEGFLTLTKLYIPGISNFAVSGRILIKLNVTSMSCPEYIGRADVHRR